VFNESFNNKTGNWAKSQFLAPEYLWKKTYPTFDWLSDLTLRVFCLTTWPDASRFFGIEVAVATFVMGTADAPGIGLDAA
jgi:hypothetical protein